MARSGDFDSEIYVRSHGDEYSNEDVLLNGVEDSAEGFMPDEDEDTKGDLQAKLEMMRLEIVGKSRDWIGERRR
ncbi:hypothetical protein PDIDSM_3801 [Penicillium digitatum]|nr:hypothetical protein PDIDSM_3801 [Penicillium digitatum]